MVSLGKNAPASLVEKKRVVVKEQGRGNTHTWATMVVVPPVNIFRTNFIVRTPFTKIISN